MPTIPWNGSHLRASYKTDGGLSQALVDAADLRTVEQAVQAAQQVGFPLMIKASEGGGGKGIRMVESMDNLESAYRQVRVVAWSCLSCVCQEALYCTVVCACIRVWLWSCPS